jgi:hypothetical protein
VSVLIDEDAIARVVVVVVFGGARARKARGSETEVREACVYMYDVDDSALVSPIQRLPSAKTDGSQRAVKRCLVGVAKGNLPYHET